MRAGWAGRIAPLAAAVLLGLPALAAPGGAPVQAEFGSPAQAQGDSTVAGQWAILLFRDAGPGTAFSLGLQGGGTVTNHTSLRWRADGPGFSPNHSPTGLPSRTSDLRDAVRGRLEPVPHSWASLYVEADALRLSAARSHAQAGKARAGDPADAFLPRGVEAEGTYRSSGHVLADAGAWLAFQGDRQPGFRFTLQATGVRRIEWHNATLACSNGGACPGAPSSESPVPSPFGEAALQVLAYTELAVPGGTLQGSGEALVGAAGGTSVEVEVAGRLRLPEARLQGSCGAAACPDPGGRTFLADGNLSLAGLSPSPSGPGRLQAGLAGAFAASFDESPVPAFGALAAGAAAVGVAALAFPLLAKALLALFARSQRPPALQHPKRQALYDLIRSEPGLSFRDIRRRLRWPNGTLSNHIGRLLDVRLVAARPHRNTVRYFEGQGRRDADATWQAVVLLRDARLRDLHDWLRANPSASQADVLRHAEARWGWRRSTTQDRLRALQEGGLVEKVARGRSTLYQARPAPSQTHAAAS